MQAMVSEGLEPNEKSYTEMIRAFNKAALF